MESALGGWHAGRAPNEIAVVIGRILPILQDLRFAWDDVQIKDIVLAREDALAAR